MPLTREQCKPPSCRLGCLTMTEDEPCTDVLIGGGPLILDEAAGYESYSLFKVV